MLSRLPRTARVSSTVSTAVRGYAKDIRYGQEARQPLLSGVEKLGAAVAVTMGPKGRTVLIEQPYGGPKVTKDGVTVAKSIELDDTYENIGAKLVQTVASNTNDSAGDGTTTATVLARAIAQEGFNAVGAGLNPKELKAGIDLAVATVIEELKRQSSPVVSDEIKQVATISANGDTAIGGLIASGYDEVGKDGVISVKDGNQFEDTLEVTQGMQFARGYISPFFANEAKTRTSEYENARVLLVEGKISNVQQVLPVLELVSMQLKQPLLIVAEDIDGEALSMMVLNRIRSNLNICAVKAPGFGDNRKATLQDIATLTGAHVFGATGSEEKLEEVANHHLGMVGEFKATK